MLDFTYGSIKSIDLFWKKNVDNFDGIFVSDVIDTGPYFLGKTEQCFVRAVALEIRV